MFVVCIVQLVLGGVFCGNQSNCRICRICRICILIGECWNGVDSLEILELVELPGKAGMSGMSGKIGRTGMSGMSGMPLEGLAAGMPGVFLEGLVRHMDGFLEDLLAFYAYNFFSGMKVSLPSVCSSSSTRRALCLLHVELDSGWRILWMHVYTCMELVCCMWMGTLVELELKNPVGLLHVE